MMAPVWIQGILSDHCGVPVDSVTPFTGCKEESGRSEKLKHDLPGNIRVEPVSQTQTLPQMLLDGEIDALCTVRTPSSFLDGGGRVKRLCENYVYVERRYFRNTCIFLIRHAVAIRREVYEANRWVAQSLYKAFSMAKRRAYGDFQATVALKTMLLWLTADLDNARNETGDDFWPYAFDRNRKALEDLSALSLRAGSFKAATGARRVVRSRIARGIQDLRPHYV